jgi:hypothetical protein
MDLIYRGAGIREKCTKKPVLLPRGPCAETILLRLGQDAQMHNFVCGSDSCELFTTSENKFFRLIELNSV